MLFQLALLFIFRCAIATADIPTSPCDIYDTAFDECYQNFISEELLEALYKDGIPEIDVIPLNNIKIPKTSLFSNSTFANGYVDLDAMISGLAEGAEVKSFRTASRHFPYLSFKLVIEHPEVVLSGNYDTVIEVNQYNISGAGTYSITLDGVTSTVEGKGIIYKGHEETVPLDHLDIHKVTASFDIQNASNVTITGLLPDEPELAETVVEILNEHPLDFFKEIYHVFEPSVVQVVQKVVKTYFDNVPIGELILEEEEEEEEEEE